MTLQHACKSYKLEDGIWEDKQVTKNLSKSNDNFSYKKNYSEC